MIEITIRIRENKTIRKPRPPPSEMKKIKDAYNGLRRFLLLFARPQPEKQKKATQH